MKIKFIGPDRPFSDIPTATMDECLSYCRDRSVLGVDTETSGLDFTKEKLLMLQIGDRDLQFVIDVRYVDISVLTTILESEHILKIFQNVKFDYKFILNEGIVLENVYDTMLVEKILYCGYPDVRVSLADICRRRLNVTLNKEVRNSFIGMTGEPFTDHQILYGADDIKHLFDIRDLQLEEIKKEKLEKVMQLENYASLAFADIEYNGLIVNREEWLAISKEEKILLVQAEKEMDDLIYNDPIFEKVIPKEVQGDLFQAPRRVNVKWSSPMQSLKVLQQVIPELSNVNGKEIYVHRTRHKLIGMYIRYKEKAKVVTSYGSGFLDLVFSDGLIHTSFDQILNTGRVSSKKPKHIGPYDREVISKSDEFRETL